VDADVEAVADLLAATATADAGPEGDA